jgi:simple sugar transport system ATP-binding protein
VVVDILQFKQLTSETISLTAGNFPATRKGGSALTDVPVLEVRGATKSYGQVEALRGVDFTVHGGEVVALIGDNGAGKSTLTKIISGTTMPDSGELLIDGTAVTVNSPVVARQLGIETIYQDLALAPSLDTPANLFLGRELLRGGLAGRLGFLDKKAMRTQTDEVYRQFGVDMRNSALPVGSLSGGQRQSVAVARAVASPSRLVILDEPTAALGVAQTASVLRLVRQIRDAGRAVVLITHNMTQVLEVADRVEVLRLGRRVAEFRAAQTSVDELVSAMTGGLDQIAPVTGTAPRTAGAQPTEVTDK